MDLRKPAMIMVSLVGVVLVLLALEQSAAGEWTLIARPVAQVIGLIAILAMIVYVIVEA